MLVGGMRRWSRPKPPGRCAVALAARGPAGRPRKLRARMIQPTATMSEDRAPAPPRWQAELAAAISDPRELLALLDLPESTLGEAAGARAAAGEFALRVPRGYVRRMR